MVVKIPMDARKAQCAMKCSQWSEFIIQGRVKNLKLCAFCAGELVGELRRYPFVDKVGQAKLES